MEEGSSEEQTGGDFSLTEDAQDEEVAEESQKLVAKRTPQEPTAKEMAEHEEEECVTYRNWCAHCVAARGVGHQHRDSPEEEENALPTVSFDYGFMGENDEEMMPILFFKDRKTKGQSATTVDQKGVSQFAVSFCVGYIRELGWKRFIWKSDNEPAILALKLACTKALGDVEIIPKESPEGDHQANGEAEAAVREGKRQIRANKCALEEKLGRHLPEMIPCWRGCLETRLPRSADTERV
jgi:hypothetical protein